jgi:cell division protein FtsI (penicillin-binding protein 3)
MVRLADPRKRLHVSLIMVFVVLSLLSGRLIQLQGLDASSYAAEARSSRMQVVPVPALRGAILDRNGQPLAQSVEAYDIVVDQKLIAEEGNVAAYALQLEEALGEPARDIQDKLTGDRRYRVLARKVTPEAWRAISDLRLTGVYSEPTVERMYPAGSVAGNIVGFVGAEGTGLAGLELSRDDHLAGEDGELAYQVARGGARIPLTGGSQEKAVPGEGLALTIDRDLQWHAEQVLSEQVEAAKASGGNAVVIDIETGEILAMASAPLVDPHDPSSTSGGGNPAVEVAYEPGSVLKALSISAVIEEGMAGPATVFSVPDNIDRADLTIRDHYDHPQEDMTLSGIIAKSSNVGTILASERLDPDTFGRYLEAFGLGVKPNLGLPAETGGQLPGEWTNLDRDFASFGQGISVNTVQLASVYATIANGGVRMPPRLIDGVIDTDGEVQPVAAAEAARVISEETAAAVTTMLEGVMGPDGTGNKVTVDGFRVAGKTGTAQAIDPSCGCYSGKVDVSFVGFAPADDPKYAVAVTVFNPTAGRSGGRVAGPVFSSVLGFALAKAGIVPSGTEPPEVALYAGDL